MSIKLVSTREAAELRGVKILVHGPAGAGKTMLCATLPGPTVIISAEAGLLALRGHDIPVIEVDSIKGVYEAYEFLMGSEEGQQFKSVALDSISEIAEVVLSAEKQLVTDKRQAYGELIEKMGGLLRAFRDLPGRNVYMSAKQEREKDEASGAMLYSPSMPGTKLGPQLPYMFDEVFALRVERNVEGETERWLQTVRDLQVEAKDRSGALEAFESPDLGAIIEKITASPAQPAKSAA